MTAIGTTETSTSITTIISTGTPIGTSIVVKLARATGGSTTRNTVEMLPMEIEGRPTNSVAEVRVAPGEPVVRVELAELVVQVASVEPVVRVDLAVPVASAEPVVQVALAVQAASEELVVQVGPAVRVALVGPASPVVLAVRVVSEEPVVPVELAELEPGPVAVAVKTKSVTAVLRYGLLAALAAEDLVVAVVGITREPAAAEAVVAWAAAE